MRSRAASSRREQQAPSGAPTAWGKRRRRRPPRTDLQRSTTQRTTAGGTRQAGAAVADLPRGSHPGSERASGHDLRRGVQGVRQRCRSRPTTGVIQQAQRPIVVVMRLETAAEALTEALWPCLIHLIIRRHGLSRAEALRMATGHRQLERRPEQKQGSQQPEQQRHHL